MKHLSPFLLLFFSLSIISGDNYLLKKQSRSSAPLSAIGRKIWLNESSGHREKLVWWNAGEDWVSVGIGHFIWYPQQQKKYPFEETFPAFLKFAQKRGRKLPPFIAISGDFSCPWHHRADFMNKRYDTEMIQLRNFLESTFDLQIQFIAKRLQEALPYILASCHSLEQQKKAQYYFNTLSSTPDGLYCLLDYSNFKGMGTNAQERYKGKGWGLTQVLETIDEQAFEENGPRAFAQAAQKLLDERVNNAPPERFEAQWLPGWKNRLATYYT